MVLIIGGAYQGKLDYARKKYALSPEDIYTCTEESGVDFGARCIYAIEEYTLGCVRRCGDPERFFREHRQEWENSVLICQDIFCGVVPLGEDMRAWRETTGRLCAYLSAEAHSVYRIFCGLEQKLK